MGKKGDIRWFKFQALYANLNYQGTYLMGKCSLCKTEEKKYINFVDEAYNGQLYDNTCNETPQIRKQCVLCSHPFGYLNRLAS